jgi:hypothetical protein
MDSLVATGLLILAASGAGAFIAKRWLTPLMQRHKLVPEQPTAPSRPWLVRAIVLAYIAATAAPLWAFATGHGRLGVILLVAIFILPEFVIVPLHIVASRRRAIEARGQRLGRR